MVDLKFSEKANVILNRYPDKKAALLPVLHLAQKEFGQISGEIEEFLSSILTVPVIKIHELISFYTMFTEKKWGRFHFQVCRNISCSMMGARHFLKYLEEKLNIKSGEVSKDGKFSVELVECIGCCGEAPALRVNETYYCHLSKEKIDTIVDELK